MAETDELEGRLCDIDHRRPAVVRVTVVENGQRRTINVCREHYAELRARQASPFESLFSRFGGLGDDLLGGFFDEGDGGGAGASAPRRTGGRSRAPGPDRESMDLTDYMSDQAEEILQQAARTAAEWGSREVDSEHLLFALADNDVVQAVLNRFKLSPEELKSQVREVSPKRERKGDGPQGGIGVSPRVKAALLAAFNASRDLGHSYLGPEHLLIGLAEEEDSLARNLLRRYGLTPEALRQQTVRVVGKGAEEGRVEGKSETPNLDKVSRDLTALAAGTQYRGQFEERVKQLLEEISANQETLILFIDELHTIIGAGATGGEGGLDIANA